MALGTTQELAVETFIDRLKHSSPPVVIDDGPVKEIRYLRYLREEVDLGLLPIPVHAPKDAGVNRFVRAGGRADILQVRQIRTRTSTA